MKRVKTMIQCLKTLLKKNFFNSQKNDKNHDCKKAFNFERNNEDLNNKKEDAEEYLNNYNTTTRWQTV